MRCLARRVTQLAVAICLACSWGRVMQLAGLLNSLRSLSCFVEWYWKLWVLPWAYRVGAVILGALSVVIVWCEVTFGIYISPDIRISALAAIIYKLHIYGDYIPVEVSQWLQVQVTVH